MKLVIRRGTCYNGKIMQNLHAGADKMKILKSVVRTVTGFMENMNKNHVSAYSAQAAYHTFLYPIYAPSHDFCAVYAP